MSNSTRGILAACAIGALAATAQAAVILEVEPNETKALANPAALVPGDVLQGNSTGTSTTVPGAASADTFLVSTAAQPVGIYRNRLVITTTGTAGHVGTIRGLGQTSANAGSVGPGTFSTSTDNTLQTSSTATTPARLNQWYTFGAPASLYYRVTGVAGTTADYTSTYTRDSVTPANLGVFEPGAFTFTNTGLASTQDTEVFIYNALTGAPVAGALNDDFLDGTPVPPGGSTLNSLLTRSLPVGQYWVAISNFNTADSQLSPADEGTATASVTDFTGVMTNSSTTTLAAIPFRMVHPTGTLDFTASKPGPYDVWFGSFTVIPEPAALSLLALAAPALLRRRRA